MKSKELLKQYVKTINDRVLRDINWAKLDRSCNSKDTSYAVQILGRLHQAFINVYGSDEVGLGLDYVFAPTILFGRTTQHIAIGLVALNPDSRGEHYGSYFFTPHGVIDDDDPDISPQNLKYIETNFMPYDYWYTIYIERDHHVDFECIPTPVAGILNHIQALPQLEQGDMQME